MGSGSIQIKCKGADALYIDQIEPFQGNLKDLSEENYKKLKKEILELGFSEPVSVWAHNNKFLLLNGHQRHRALLQMKKEGFEIPKIPVSFVEAKDIKEAKKKVLALTSQYGEITKQGLYEFMNEAEISMPELSDSFRFPEINLDVFKLEFFDNGEVVEDLKKEWAGMPEFDHEDETAFKTLKIHFQDLKGIEDFSKLIGQPLTKDTRSVWYPEKEIKPVADLVYESEKP